MADIRQVLVSEDQDEHIWIRHHVTREEVYEVCFSEHLVTRGRGESSIVYGQTEGGRYLLVFLYRRDRGVYRLATARDMTDTERRFYRTRRR